MNNRPRITPQLTLTMIWSRGNNTVSSLPRNLLRHINMLSASHELKEVEDAETLKPYITWYPRDPIPFETLRGKNLFLLLESDGKHQTGEIVLESGASIGRMHPRNVIRYFRDFNLDSDGQWNSDIACVLYHIAFGNPTEAKNILDQHPELNMQRGHVIIPTGDLICGVTPYECGLCVGDHHRDKNPELSMLPMLATHLVNFADEK